GEDFVKINSEKPQGHDLEKDSFIFCVGTLEIRKNHQLLYNAYKLAVQKNIDLPKIVIVGKKGWLAESTIHTLELDPEVSDKVIMLNRCSDKEMAWLYENCLFTVYPSYYEGWGLPIAESLRYGKMCLSSNTSSMPEVAGDLIDYFSPFDSGELLDKIVRYLDEKELDSKSKNIKKKYKTTSWDDAYKQVIKLIEENC
ncbi:MAG: glycosyltransferase family 4 protein, partial [Flavobacteriaceae bacterium]|nr:glycosyltransferase family 4 protein [Flavobacteriaceae bacterium]